MDFQEASSSVISFQLVREGGHDLPCSSLLYRVWRDRSELWRVARKKFTPGPVKQLKAFPPAASLAMIIMLEAPPGGLMAPSQ
ncbi:hypothetical protein RRG08_007961 [Elysia crispata]|uniref:Uncharacterized protein n=1 Tax=Elysia crispata TaxID=231223 RepID=A0AAE1DJY0_9GAST|nr:hypothetical protein RRG08_007961 [Elysia crispata]